MSYLVGQCAARGNLRHLRILIERDGNSVHDFDGCGQTPLHMAAWAGHPDVCQYLLSKGANINLRDSEGHTPLDLALSGDHRETVALLRSHGAVTGAPARALKEIYPGFYATRAEARPATAAPTVSASGRTGDARDSDEEAAIDVVEASKRQLLGKLRDARRQHAEAQHTVAKQQEALSSLERKVSKLRQKLARARRQGAELSEALAESQADTLRFKQERDRLLADEDYAMRLRCTLALKSVQETVEDPILMEPLRDAVMTPCGHTFSATSLAKWLQRSTHCPRCKARVLASQVVPNYAMRDVVAAMSKVTVTDAAVLDGQ